MNWDDSYIGKLRSVVGSQKIIVPSIRAIIEDQDGKILFIERKGEGNWSIPAGSIELNESIYECLVREVKEETDLDVISAKALPLLGHCYYL